MKINGSIGIQNVVKAYQNNMPKTEKKSGASFESDKIEISDEARVKQAAMQAAKQIPDVREDKVAEIKQQIKDGTYRPTADQIVEKMFALVK